ncbi:MAG: MBL fold metallo-hydrolase [Christensenellales bacterium]|jgi:ribonuclease BN (tRNA processing enzyme)|nr:MBL fold metallo-hydrolase [Clostridiales bacterium]
MKLSITGRYGKYPNQNGATCGYVAESSKGTKIVLDMGSGSLRNLSKLMPYSDIDAVVISHFHGDHCADAFVFRNIAVEYVKSGVWEAPLPFFMPNEPYEEYAALKSCLGFDSIVIHDGCKFTVKDLELTFYKLEHPLPVYGVKIKEEGGKVLSYTADTVMCDNLLRLVEGCDMALVDACLLEKNHTPQSPHISVKEMAFITRDIPLTALTHLEKGQEAQILEEALSQNKNAFLVEELKTYQL